MPAFLERRCGNLRGQHDENEKGKPWTMWIAVFFILLVCPGILFRIMGSLVPDENFENRKLAEMPVFRLETMSDYPQEYEAYYDDNLPFRNQIIQANSILNLEVFRDASSDSVMLGKDNWLFYTGDSSIDDYKGIVPFNGEELEQIKENLLLTRDYLESRGMEFVLMIPPTKESIYGEFLPDYIIKRQEHNRAWQVIDYMRGTDIRIVYPKEELLRYHEQYDVYWHYDTHWNYLGGYIGAKALVEELGGGYLPPVEHLELEEKAYSPHDLTNMMNLTKHYDKKRPGDVDYNIYGYPLNNREIIKDDYATEAIYTSDAPDERKLFMIRDSFGAEMAPFLGASFAECYVARVDSDYKSKFENESPDILVYEILERSLKRLLEFRMCEG